MASSRNRRRRRRSRGRFSFLFKLLSLAAAAAALTLGATVFFQLERVEVEGNSRYTAQEIEAASSNYLQLQELYERRQVLEDEIAALYRKWEALAAELEEAQA